MIRRTDHAMACEPRPERFDFDPTWDVSLVEAAALFVDKKIIYDPMHVGFHPGDQGDVAGKRIRRGRRHESRGTCAALRKCDEARQRVG